MAHHKCSQRCFLLKNCFDLAFWNEYLHSRNQFYRMTVDPDTFVQLMFICFDINFLIFLYIFMGWLSCLTDLDLCLPERGTFSTDVVCLYFNSRFDAIPWEYFINLATSICVFPSSNISPTRSSTLFENSWCLLLLAGSIAIQTFVAHWSVLCTFP